MSDLVTAARREENAELLAMRRSRPGLRARLRGLVRTRPRRIRLLTVAAFLAVVGLVIAASLSVAHARRGLDVIGHGAGPQVVTTANLYYALSDMDAQVASVLLIGKEHDLGIGRAAALKRYDQRRADADRAVLEAIDLIGDDAAARTTVTSVLDGMGTYERLVSQALLLDQRANHVAGPPPARVVDLYRQATDLMTLDLLPKAYNLTLSGGTVVRASYQVSMTGMASGRVWTLVFGLIAFGLLLWLQVFLSLRFRRTFNPALVVATVLVLAMTIGTVVLVGAQSDHLRTAKTRGFDAVLELSRARAIGTSATADESRYLLDPGRADTYEQTYLEKAQTVLYLDSGNLKEYDDGLERSIADRSYLGFLGEERKTGGDTAALRATLAAYRTVQDQDREMRAAVAAGERHHAVAIRTGASTTAAQAYDTALTKLTAGHRQTLDGAVLAGDRGRAGWDVGLPIAALVAVVLLLVGVRPRLAEYR